jgi:O-antigen/teichoic acid export membrane protein
MIFKNILHTAGSRILNAGFNLIILLLVTRFVGSNGFGTISLIVLDITVIQLFTGLIAGGSLIYFTSRRPVSALLFGSYLWILLITAIFSAAGYVFGLLFPELFHLIVPEGYYKDILILVIINSFMQVHYNLLIGQKRITLYNLLFVIQITLFLIWFSTALIFFHEQGIGSYVTALFVSWLTGGIISLFFVLQKVKDFAFKSPLKTFQYLIRYGLPTQLAVTLHIGNKRLGFYVLRIFSGLSPLGIYSAGVQLTEGLRLIGQSISLVQYSAISNSRNREYARQLSIRLMKFSLILTSLALFILLIIPQSVYQRVFSYSFSGIKTIVFFLSPGVMALAANTIFSHYFSGIGQPKVNLKANSIGFLFTVIFAFLLIPPFGYVGAAITASANYTASVIYQGILFKKQTHTRLSEWMIRKEDIRFFKETVKTWRQKKEVI